MADKTIGDLPAASAIYDDDLFLLEQSGEAKNLRGALYKAYLQGFVDAASAASEEAAAALAGVRDAINNIPEGAATPIVNDLTTGGTSMALSAEMGKKLKGELDTKVNPNLLDNWYFGNPVNQRGQTEYSGVGYTIDRWRNVISSAVLVTENGLQIGSSGEVALKQYAELEKFGNKGICTLSVLINENTFRSVTGAFDTTKSGWQLQKWVGSVFVGLQIESGSVWGVTISSSSENTIKAVKLELGTQQTLAHQDANGNWVLNEIPDYSEQLLRCCMSTADSSDTYANNKRTAAAVKAVPLDGSKAMTGVQIMLNNGKLRLVDNGGAQLETLDTANDFTNRRNLVVRNHTSQPNLSGAVILNDVVDGAAKTYTILHTGNKPSGSYTGNGSAAARTIDVGGIGRAMLIRSSDYGNVIASFYSSKLGENPKNFTSLEVSYSDGKLYLATNHDAVNRSGVTYYYQVL